VEIAGERKARLLVSVRWNIFAYYKCVENKIN